MIDMNTTLRKSRIAGSWYAGDSNKLQDNLREIFLNKEFGPGKLPKPSSKSQKLYGIVSPHAGHIYSGYTAAHAYSYLYESIPEIDLAIILGVNHRGYGSEVAFSEKIWETPLGKLEIDPDMVSFISNYQFNEIKTNVDFDDSAHDAEHSIEIQLPFLQFLYKQPFSIFPISLGNRSLKPYSSEIAAFLQAFMRQYPDKKVVIIASSDFSHEYGNEKVEKNDAKMIELLKQNKLEEANQFREKARVTMCGYSPIFILLELANLLGEPEITHLHYSHSAQIMGKKQTSDYCVGYASFAITA